MNYANRLSAAPRTPLAAKDGPLTISISGFYLRRIHRETAASIEKGTGVETTLNLLTRDGSVFMAFRPALSTEQYESLLALAQQSQSAEELRRIVQLWADSLRLSVRFTE